MKPNKVSRITRAYGKTINVLNYLRIAPYKWCELHQRLEYRPFKAYWVILLGVLAAFHEAFFAWQAMKCFSSPQSVDLITLTRTFFLAFGYITCNCNFYAILKDPPVHAALVNSMTRTANRFYDRHPKEKRGNDRGLLALFWILKHVVVGILPVILALPVFWNPHSSFLYTSLLQNPEGYGLISRPAVFLIQTYTTALHLGMLAYNTMTMTICLFFITDMLRITSFHVRGNWNDSRYKVRFLKFNMETSVLVSCLNEIFREWMSGIEFGLAVSVTVNTTVTVLTGMPRSLLGSAAAFMALSSTISMSGNASTLSASILGSDGSMAKRKTTHSWFEKSRRAFRPLRIEFGRLFYADKCLMLTVLSSILQNIANLLVVLRNP